jgi:hypothetical protein
MGNNLGSGIRPIDKTNDPVEAFVGLPAHRYTPLSNDTPQLRLLRLFPGNFNDPLKGRLSVTALGELERDNGRMLAGRPSLIAGDTQQCLNHF